MARFAAVCLALLAAVRADSCKTDADCDGTLKCVTQADGYYSQCVDCTEASFESQCTYWSEEIIVAAEDACKVSCPGRCAGHEDSECDDGLVCVVQADGFYDQCTNCTAEAFQKDCAYWSDDIKAAAEAKCALNCTGAPATDDKTDDAQCKTDADCDAALVCVTQADGLYAQCVDCTEDSFDSQCGFWSDKIVLAAEDKCALSCPTRCANHTDAECPGALVCVVQSDGNWNMCTDCTEATFDAQCVYWSAEMKAAAEDKCGLKCPSAVAA